MSFSLTKAAFLDGTKTVTRRLGWKGLAPGTRIMAVEKAMGLRKGEKMVELGEIEVWSVTREPLSPISKADVVAEGFPNMEPHEFVAGFCKAMGCAPLTEVTRIELRRVT